MFENRRYQGVTARAGRGRHTRICRRIFEFNLLIIGALIFVGVGIASLPSDTGQTATLKTPAQKNARLHEDKTGAPKFAVATQQALKTAARPPRDTGTRSSGPGIRWVRAPHPLAVPLPLAKERPTHRVMQTSYGLIATGDFSKNPPAPMVRLDTTTGKSPFWFILAGLSLAAFVCGFWNSRKSRP